jgi:CobQ-like glutamine amidotransferase family enzyme
MIRVASFYPDFFNNNSDQGNLLVLRRQLQWRGMELEVLEDFDPNAQFVLIGDASRAAIRHFEVELEALTPALQSRLDRKLPTLIVGSSFEFFANRLKGLGEIGQTERKSEFRTVISSEVEAFGYRNSELDTDLVVAGGFVATTLFGPVLAKSPSLLAHLLGELGVEGELPQATAAELELLVQEIQKRASAG